MEGKILIITASEGTTVPWNSHEQLIGLNDELGLLPGTFFSETNQTETMSK